MTATVVLVRFFLGEDSPLLLFVMAVVPAAWYGGRKPGLLATVLSGLAGNYCFLQPLGSLYIAGTKDRIWMGAFIIVSGLICWLCEALRAAQHRTKTKQRQLEQEIAERQKTEEALRQSQAFLQAIIDNSTTAIFFKDREGRHLLVNREFCKLFHITQEKMLGLTDYDIFPQDVADCLRINDRQVIEHKQTIQREEVVPVNGETQTYVSVKFPLYDSTGEPYAVGGIATNITYLKRAEQAVLKSEAQLRRLMDSSLFGVAFTDQQWQITAANDYFLQMLGYTREDLTTKPLRWNQITPPEWAEIDREARKQLLQKGVCGPFEKEYLRKDNTKVPVLVGAVLLDKLAGQQEGFIGFGLDLTRLKQTEEALKEANRRKDEFLATLAHELRNPLAPILNAVNILRSRGTAEPELQWCQDVIDRQVQQMARLLDDLLDVSRITRNRLLLRKKQIELAEVVQNAVEVSTPLLAANSHELTVTLPSEPLYVEADLTRLAQVFSNLLNNAARYTERNGHIWLTAERHSNEIVVTVKDTGIGIPAEMLAKVFDLFTQVERPLKWSRSGLGIGLALTKQLVEMHGGSIEAYSPGSGKGSEFVVRLPMVVPSRTPELQQLSSQDRGLNSSQCRVLVVDDNRDAANTLATLLQAMGNEIHTAYDGLEAIEAAAKFQPEVVLLDLRMPKLNGYDAACRIRAHAWGQHMVLIALTGWGQEEDRRRAQEAGFDHHLVKPVEPAALLKLLAEIQRNRSCTNPKN